MFLRSELLDEGTEVCFTLSRSKATASVLFLYLKDKD